MPRNIEELRGATAYLWAWLDLQRKMKKMRNVEVLKVIDAYFQHLLKTKIEGDVVC